MLHASFILINSLLIAPFAFIFLLTPIIPARYMNFSQLTLTCNAQAINRGYPMILVRMMASFQHLTVCTMIITAFYLVLVATGAHTPTTCLIRTILPGAGACVAQYWTFIFIFGPWSLVPREEFPKDNKEAMHIAKCCFMYPSYSRYFVFYLLMHLQHTWIPFLPWVEEFWYKNNVHNICPRVSLVYQILMTLAYLFSWLLWGLSCWYVRNRPPYPILLELWRNGKWPVLYSGMIIFTLAACHVNHWLF